MLAVWVGKELVLAERGSAVWSVYFTLYKAQDHRP